MISQPFATVVVTSSFSPLIDVPPDTVRVAAVLSFPAVPPVIIPNSLYVTLENSLVKVLSLITFSTPKDWRDNEILEPSWMYPSVTVTSNSVGEISFGVNVNPPSRPSWRIQTLFSLALTFAQRLARRYVILSPLLGLRVEAVFKPFTKLVLPSSSLNSVNSELGNLIVNLDPTP